MVYQPDLDWVDDAPPGFTSERMGKMQLGIAEASQTASAAANSADLAMLTATAAQETADEALANAGSGGVVTVDGDVERIYLSTTTPPNGEQPADLVVSLASVPAAPIVLLPDLYSWIDASQTLVGDVGATLPDVSGQGNHFSLSSGRTSAVGGTFNGLSAFDWRTNTRYQSGSGGSAQTAPGDYLLIAGAVRLANTGENIQCIWTDNSAPYTRMEIDRSAALLRVYLENVLIASTPVVVPGAVVFVVLLDGLDSAVWVNGARVSPAAAVPQPDVINGRLLGQVGTANTLVGAVLEYVEAKGTNAPSDVVCIELSHHLRQKWRI